MEYIKTQLTQPRMRQMKSQKEKTPSIGCSTRSRQKANVFYFNTISPAGYLIRNFILAVLSFFIYTNNFFVNVDSFDDFTSKGILIVALIVSVISGVALTFKSRRNYMSITANISTAYIFYFLISVSGNIKLWYLWIFIISIMTTSVYSIKKIYQKASYDGFSRHKIFKLIKHYFLCIRNVVSMFFILFIVFISVHFTINATMGNTLQTTASIPQNRTIESSLDSIIVFEEIKWKRATIEEKLDGLQNVSDIEASRLELSVRINVELEALGDKTIACYNDSERKIYFNTNYITDMSSEMALNSICHEVFHALQAKLKRTYTALPESFKTVEPFNYIAKYDYEFKNYCSGEDNIYDYYNQALEKDARKYADAEVQRYNEYIKLK